MGSICSWSSSNTRLVFPYLIHQHMTGENEPIECQNELGTK